MLCLILAAVLMLSHGSMGAAVPHGHAANDHHHAGGADHHGDHEDGIAGEDGAGKPDGDTDVDVDVTAHVHLVAGLTRVASTGDWPVHILAVPPPLPATMRLLVSREVPPLLEPPTA